MTTHPRPFTAFGLTCVLGLAAAGCGSNATSEPSATGGSSVASGAGSTKQTGAPKLTSQEKAVKFADCMRGHGVADFPDPDAKGDFQYGVSVSPTVFTRAVDACKALKPPGALSSKRTPQQQSASLKFAACMRSNGVEDFPDPVQGEPVINTYKIPSANRPGGMTILNAATAKCKTLLDQLLAGK